MSKAFSKKTSELNEIFIKNHCVIIAGHVRPDGDCIGACLAVGMGLRAAGKDVYVILEDYAEKFMCIPGVELIYSGDTRSLAPDVFIACDCADKSRIGGGASDLFDRAKITVCLDHHDSNIGFADYNIIDPEISSTCELVFNTVLSILPTTPDIDTAICAGIIYDTGGLRYESASIKTFKLVNEMHARNIPFRKLLNSLIYEHSFTESKVLAKVIENSAMIEGYPVLISYISRAELNDIEAELNDLDGIIEYLSGTRGVDITMFAYERDCNTIKFSLRSKGFDVGKIASSMGGGGHKMAAGYERLCGLSLAIAEAVEMIKKNYYERN